MFDDMFNRLKDIVLVMGIVLGVALTLIVLLVLRALGVL